MRLGLRQTPRLNLLSLWIAVALPCLGSTALASAPKRHAARHRHLYPHIRQRGSVFVVAPIKPPAPIKPKIPTAVALYQRSLKAYDRWNFRGRRVITNWRTGHSTSVIVSHQAPDLRRIDWLAPDSQRGRSFVTDETQEWQFDPRRSVLQHWQLAPGTAAAADAAVSYDLLRQNYVLATLPQTRTAAERKVFVLILTRKAEHTTARKLWVDAGTGLVLKEEKFGEEGKLVATVSYTDITFHPRLARDTFNLERLAARPGIRRVEEAVSSETPLARSAIRTRFPNALVPNDLAGFRLISASRGTADRRPRLHLRYSDGLTIVSLFEQPRLQLSRPTRVPTGWRPTLIGRTTGHFSRRLYPTLNWDQGAFNLTLMGETETSEARLLRLASTLANH